MSAPAKVLVAHGDLPALELDVDAARAHATAGDTRVKQDTIWRTAPTEASA